MPPIAGCATDAKIPRGFDRASFIRGMSVFGAAILKFTGAAFISQGGMTNSRAWIHRRCN